MKLATTFLGLALLLCATAASAQMYRWVDANGKTHFTDTPPPPSAKETNVRATTSAASSVTLPYALAQAVRNHPVVLFTAVGCGGCDLGRTFLRARGIPFTEKTVNTGADEEKLREAGSAGQLPLLLVGRSRSIGFEAGTWDGLLNAATYPAQKMLPPSYQYPVAVAAAPVQAAPPPAAALQSAAAEPVRKSRKKVAEAPPPSQPAFQF